MKKNFFMLAATAALFAACAETDLVNEVNVVVEPQAIGFETFANKATRDTENSEEGYTGNLETHHKSFKVWASKQLADDSYVDVYAASSPGTVKYGTAWVANPLKYWDKAAKNYQFYAAAPAEASWNATNTNSASGCITLADYVLKGESKDNVATLSNSLKGTWGKATTSNDKDLMIAAACKIESTHYYNNENPDPVHLNFIHLLSKLNIAVNTTAADVELVKLDVCGLNNKSSFNEFADIDGDSDFDDVDKGALVDGSTKRWGTATLDGTYTLAAAGTLPLALTKDAAAVYTHEYLIMPQLQQRQDNCKGLGTAPTNDAYIYIEYTIDDEPYKAYYGLAEVFGIAIDGNLAFNEGWQNTLTISIEPDAITFTGDVAVWDDNIGSGSLDID